MSNQDVILGEKVRIGKRTLIFDMEPELLKDIGLNEVAKTEKLRAGKNYPQLGVVERAGIFCIVPKMTEEKFLLLSTEKLRNPELYSGAIRFYVGKNAKPDCLAFAERDIIVVGSYEPILVQGLFAMRDNDIFSTITKVGGERQKNWFGVIGGELVTKTQEETDEFLALLEEEGKNYLNTQSVNGRTCVMIGTDGKILTLNCLSEKREELSVRS